MTDNDSNSNKLWVALIAGLFTLAGTVATAWFGYNTVIYPIQVTETAFALNYTQTAIAIQRLTPTPLPFTSNSPLLILPTTNQPDLPTLSPTSTVTPSPTQIAASDLMVQIYVPAGNFEMGDSSSAAREAERPQHTVFLSAYWIDQLEVTNAQYNLCVRALACGLPASRSSQTQANYYDQFPNYPVIYVSWYQARDYCHWAGRRLPSEAEWERAAQGPGKSLYPWGNNLPAPSLLNFNNNFGDTTPVGMFKYGASLLGALDMVGNVWEWVADWYDPTYYAIAPNNNPTGPQTGTERILRGGSWRDNGSVSFNIFHRNPYLPTLSEFHIGFRCAQDAP